jgi:lipopolysaccharide export LptBFGC system permease protein LptF
MNLSEMIPNVSVLRKKPYEMNSDELNAALTNAKNYNERYDTMLDIDNVRLSIPFSSLAFIFLTIPLGVKRKIEGKFSGMLYSLLLFLFYYLLMALAENAGMAIHLPVIITSFLPNFIFVAMGFYLLKNLNEEEYTTVSQKLRYFWMYCLEKTK